MVHLLAQTWNMCLARIATTVTLIASSAVISSADDRVLDAIQRVYRHGYSDSQMDKKSRQTIHVYYRHGESYVFVAGYDSLADAREIHSELQLDVGELPKSELREILPPTLGRSWADGTFKVTQPARIAEMTRYVAGEHVLGKSPVPALDPSWADEHFRVMQPAGGE